MKNILIIVGPSAVGKTTLATALLEIDPRFEFVRSVTTRAPRGDSFDNEYIYISHDEFRHLIDTAGVLEHTEYAGNLYGTPRSEIDRITAAGGVPLLVLDINGAVSLSKNRGDISPCSVYVYDDIEVMDERLRLRYGGDESRMASRVKQNRQDFCAMCDYVGYFYAFSKNSETVKEGAERLYGIFRNFENGVCKNEEENLSVAASLGCSITDKK